MNCPLCTNQILQPHYRAGIEIDVCPHCRGVWLDRGELEKLVSGANPGTRVSEPGPSPIAPQPEYLRSVPDGRGNRDNRDDWDHDDDRDDRDDPDDRRRDPDKGKKQHKKSKKKRKKKSWGEMLGDVLEEVLD